MSQTTGFSVPVLGLLGAVLVVLKLLGKISISWIWALAPFWIPAIFALIILFVLLVIAVLVAAVK